MAQDNQIPQDEERRLLTNSDECRAQERALAEQLLHPRRSMLYPEAMRLANAFQSIRIECKENGLHSGHIKQKCESVDEPTRETERLFFNPIHFSWWLPVKFTRSPKTQADPAKLLMP